MKYNSTNKPLICMQTQSACYKGTRPMTVRGVLWHSTGANNPNLSRYVQPSDNAAGAAAGAAVAADSAAGAVDRQQMLLILGTNKYGNDINHTTRQMGVNAWIGRLANGEIATVQAMPWDYKPWGCGNGSRGSCNDGWIQFEICEDGLNDRDYAMAVYREACELTAYLCRMFGIDPRGTVRFNGVTVPRSSTTREAALWGWAATTEISATGSRNSARPWIVCVRTLPSCWRKRMSCWPMRVKRGPIRLSRQGRQPTAHVCSEEV